MKAVIASSMAPEAENWDGFVASVMAAFPKVEGLTLSSGPGCWNYGVIGLDNDGMRQLTMALMPARWTDVPDDDGGVVVGEFVDKR